MDEDKFIDELLAKVKNEKIEMKQAGKKGFQSKGDLLNKLQSNNESNDDPNGQPWQVQCARYIQKEHRRYFRKCIPKIYTNQSP
jgi:hypothetical protein